MDLATKVERVRERINRWLTEAGFPRDWFLVPVAALIGAAAGAVAQGYGQLVRLSEHLFYGRFGGHALIAARWWLLLFLPLSGAALVGLVKAAFRLPLFSHGIPEVLEAVARRRGRLPIRAGMFTAINSAITIGSGGSAGQEGPIVHIGSVVGSTVGKWLRVGREHMGTLLGCGAAAGLAAIFQAPIAGVLLVLEVLLRDFSFRSFMPIVIASVIGVVTSQMLGGQDAPLFSLHHTVGYRFTLLETLPYLTLGAVCGLVGWAFTTLLYAVEDRVTRLDWPTVLKPMSGALVLGLMGIAMVWVFPSQIPNYRPTCFGNGYPVIETLLSPDAYTRTPAPGVAVLSLGFLVLMVLSKLFGTCLTLGSGGSGGLFAPCLFIGAASGASFGVAIRSTGLFPELSPAAYALAGMAGVLSGAVHCPLTAIILVFEITRDYAVIMPVMFVAIAATAVAQYLLRDSIYTRPLQRMGLKAGDLDDPSILRRTFVSQVPLAAPVCIRADMAVQKLLELMGTQPAYDYVVCGPDGRYMGMVVSEELRVALLNREAASLVVVGELMRTDLPTVSLDDSLDSVLDQFARHDVLSLPVLDDRRAVLGMITRSRLTQCYQRAIEDR
jgi:CIC family chloride channel protein